MISHEVDVLKVKLISANKSVFEHALDKQAYFYFKVLQIVYRLVAFFNKDVIPHLGFRCIGLVRVIF